MTIEIVDYPLKLVIFHSYVNVYQRVYVHILVGASPLLVLTCLVLGFDV